MSEIKPGDVVQLKSGGPKMTVGNPAQDRHSSVPTPEVHTCYWFIGSDLRTDPFHIDSLKVVKDDS